MWSITIVSLPDEWLPGTDFLWQSFTRLFRGTNEGLPWALGSLQEDPFYIDIALWNSYTQYAKLADYLGFGENPRPWFT